MEKRTPTYDLAGFREEFCSPKALRMTRTAQDTALQLGLTLRDVVQVVQSMKRAHFYKSMTTHADHTVWQDVYHAMTPVGKEAYIKVTGTGGGLPPVIQFKEK